MENFLLEIANKLSVEMPELLEKTLGTIDTITPDPIADFFSEYVFSHFGNLLTVIAPIWNPVWAEFNELLDLMFGF